MAKKLKDIDLESTQATLASLERLSRLMRQACHAGGLFPVQWEVLRYLVRANRFSRLPWALAKYLGATKGTVSQTVLALEKKGLIEKTPSVFDTRSVNLALTALGYSILNEDPLKKIENSIALLGEKTRKRFSKGVAEILTSEYLKQNEPSFGTCGSCRYFREGDENATCMFYNAEIAPSETKLICVGHVSAD